MSTFADGSKSVSESISNYQTSEESSMSKTCSTMILAAMLLSLVSVARAQEEGSPDTTAL